MSCWRSYECKALQGVKESFLDEALAEMGLRLNRNKTTVHAPYEGRTDKVTGVLEYTNGRTLSLGLVIDEKNKQVQVVGDFWDTGLNELEFTDNLSQIYQKINLVDKISLAGYNVESIETNAKGEIEIMANGF